MDQEPPNQFDRKREGVMASVRVSMRELAERSSNGTRVRLLWRQGTRRLWVEVRGPDDRVLAIPVQPERALDASTMLPAGHLRYAPAKREQLGREESTARAREAYG